LIYLFSGLKWRFFAARLAQAILGAFLAPMTYQLTKRVFPNNDGEAVPRIAAWFITVYPMLVLYPLALATENLFIPLVTGALIVLLKAQQSRHWKHYLIAGILLGMAILTRSVIVLFVPIAMLWAWHYGKSKFGAGMILAAVVVLTVPWAVRNTKVHGRLTYVETAIGYSLYVSHHPESTGSFQFGPSLDLIAILDDVERDQIGREKTMEFIRQDPVRVPYLMLRRLGHFFGLERRALTYFYSNNFFGFIPFPLLLFISIVFLSPFVVLALLGIGGIPFLRKKSEIIIALLFLGVYLFPHLIIIAEPRFHLAIVPVLACMAARTLNKRQEILVRMRSKSDRIVTIIAVILVLSLLLGWTAELFLDIDKLRILFGPDGNLAAFPY
jgi:4-amino-4-deoxy-L-arabinose transferase-like glycosyltransferase